MAKINETLTVTGEDTKIIKVQVEGIKEDTKQNRDNIKYIKEKVENLSAMLLNLKYQSLVSCIYLIPASEYSLR